MGQPPKWEDLPDWLTPDEARVYLRCGRRQMYEALKKGDIPSRRVGRGIRIPKVAIKPELVEDQNKRAQGA